MIKLNKIQAIEKEEFAPVIQLISNSFGIPQLDQHRRIWALLPHDYHQTTKSYPVLYLQDAQNLFNEQAPFGNWAIDKHMANLASKGMGDLIIIAIDHGGRERIKEYSPYFHRKFGKGNGHKYAEFMVQTLIPYVNAHFRTLTDRDHTGIGGSSMGGLISAYIGLVHAKFFSKLMIFSPSFWYSDKIYFDAFNYDYTLPSKIFIYGGDKESEQMSKHIHRFADAVKDKRYHGVSNDWKIEINPKGHHTERDWGIAFPNAIKWLFFTNELTN